MIRQEPKTPPSMQPYERLAMRIIEVAIHDAKKHKNTTYKSMGEAREWLCASPLCKLICQSLNLDQGMLKNWVKVGCPGEERASKPVMRWLITKDT